MEKVSLQGNCRNLFAINTGDQKGAGEEHSKAPLGGWQKHFPARKDMITFNCKLFSVSYSSCLSANVAEARISSQTYGGGILPWPQISLVGVATLD